MTDFDILNQIKRPEKEVNIKDAEKFMKSSSNQDGAEFMLRQKAKDKNWTRQEFIEHAKKHGYLKTEKDAQIVQHVIKKEKIKDYPDNDKARYRQERAEKKWDDYITRHSSMTSNSKIREREFKEKGFKPL